MKNDPHGKTLERLKFTYFDKTVYQPDQTKKSRERIQPDEINCSGAKNLKFLRGVSTKRSSQSQNKISIYLQNAKEMAEIEKILIKKEDIEEMRITKERNMEVCSRYTKNMSQSKLNIQKIIEARKPTKSSKSSLANTFYSNQTTSSWVPQDTFYNAPKSALALRHELCTKHMGGPDPYAVLADKFYPKVASHTYNGNFYK